MKSLKILLLCSFFTVFENALSADLGFRFADGVCKNGEGQTGYNPSFLGQCADMRGVKLGNLNLEGIDFSGSQFQSSELNLIDVSRGVFISVDFTSAKLSGVNFSEAVIKQSLFENSILRKPILFETHIEDVEFKNASLSEADLSFSIFIKTKFISTDFSDATLDSVEFRSCLIKDSSFASADLSNSEFIGTELDTIDFQNATLTGIDFSGLSLDGANFSLALLSNAKFVGVSLNNARFDSAYLNGASFERSSGEAVSFRSAELSRVDFKDSMFQSSNFKNANLQSANLQKADFQGCNLLKANLTDAVIVQVDFSKCEFNKKTQMQYTMDEALDLGMLFLETRYVFILWDQKTDSLTKLVTMLEEQDMEVTLSEKVENEFDGTEDLNDYDAVLLLNGTTFNNGIQDPGQIALVNFVENGGNFVATDWTSYELLNNRMLLMVDIVPLEAQNFSAGPGQFKKMQENADHPVLNGVGDEFEITSANYSGKIREYSESPAVSLMEDDDGRVLVAAREYKNGRAVSIAVTGNYQDGKSLEDANAQALIVNALEW